jgi:hypothetical protein
MLKIHKRFIYNYIIVTEFIIITIFESTVCPLTNCTFVEIQLIKELINNLGFYCCSNVEDWRQTANLDCVCVSCLVTNPSLYSCITGEVSRYWCQAGASCCSVDTSVKK